MSYEEAVQWYGPMDGEEGRLPFVSAGDLREAAKVIYADIFASLKASQEYTDASISALPAGGGTGGGTGGSGTGSQGPAGPAGARGSLWGSGTAPASSLTPPAGGFRAGDHYLLNTGQVWRHNGTVWADTGVNLRGPAGSPGQQGPAGPTVVSADAGNVARLGTDMRIYVPAQAGGGVTELPPHTPMNHGDVLSVNGAGAVFWSSVFGDDLTNAIERTTALEAFRDSLTRDAAEPWQAQSYPADSVVLHNGGLWVNTGRAAQAGEVPGVDPKWDSLQLEAILAKAIGGPSGADIARLQAEIGDPQVVAAHTDLVGYIGEVAARVSALEATPEDPVAETTLLVDNYSNGFARISAGALPAAGQHVVAVTLASSPGPGGAVLANTDALRALANGMWADFSGTLGRMNTATGVLVQTTTLADWIDSGALLTVHKDVSDPAHPVLVVDRVTIPTPTGSTLDARYEQLSHKGQADGYVPLDSTSMVPPQFSHIMVKATAPVPADFGGTLPPNAVWVRVL